MDEDWVQLAALIVGVVILAVVVLALMSNDDGTMNLMYVGRLFGAEQMSMGKTTLSCDNPKGIELKPFHMYRVRLESPFHGVVEGES